MGDTIQLLPDHIANKIAAGEVIQRPSSAVKELLENAVDAGATHIQLIVNDAGKSLIRVIDNGKGMSESDARMCFERHATSKISGIDDLFQIRTMGFRGEALASIAAVSQVELRTKRAEDKAGTLIEVENSAVIRMEPAGLSNGTNIAMKNLFFNIPARRNFLKSNAAEMRHIMDEFIRVALAFPQIIFSLNSNGQEVFHLEKGPLKQRIIQIMGSGYSTKLVSVQEKTDYLNIYGFVGKPEAAKKTRGDQYFFVNNRFIRSPYLHHAVMNAFQALIAPNSHPLYVLFIDLDPAQVDVNVHPTKQEVKFEDEKIIYAFVQAAVKHALAQFSITPTLEFDLDPGIQQLDAVSQPFTKEKQESAASSSLYRDFTQKFQAHAISPERKSNLGTMPSAPPVNEKFESLLTQLDREGESGSLNPFNIRSATAPLQLTPDTEAPITQMLMRYLLVNTNRGFIIVHQQLAHERILYERYVSAPSSKGLATQRSLFPVSLSLTAGDSFLLEELIPELKILGYEVEPFGKDTFIIQGTPADLEAGNEKQALEQLLEEYKHFNPELKLSKREKLVRSLAMQHALKPGKTLSPIEMQALVVDLFNCALPNTTPGGQPTFIEFRQEYLEKLFSR